MIDISKITSGTVADVLDDFGYWGVLPNSIRLINGRTLKFYGEAYTVNWKLTRKTSDIKAPQLSTWDQVADFLAPNVSDGIGKVYVGGCKEGAIDGFALAGGLSCTYFNNLGYSAVVLGGGVRDKEDLDELDIPVYATGLTPADTQGCYSVESAGTSTKIGDVTIQTGDYIFGDATGIIAIPRHLAKQVIEKSNEIEDVELSMMKEIKRGKSLPEIIQQGGRC